MAHRTICCSSVMFTVSSSFYSVLCCASNAIPTQPILLKCICVRGFYLLFFRHSTFGSGIKYFFRGCNCICIRIKSTASCRTRHIIYTIINHMLAIWSLCDRHTCVSHIYFSRMKIKQKAKKKPAESKTQTRANQTMNTIRDP